MVQAEQKILSVQKNKTVELESLRAEIAELKKEANLRIGRMGIEAKNIADLEVEISRLSKITKEASTK